jgi:hypothetical protein
MSSNLIKREDICGTALLKPDGSFAKVFRRCPHCGMTDYEYSTQGMKKAHWQMLRVGGKRKYECGKCRQSFTTLEIQFPTNMDIGEVYFKVNEFLSDLNKEEPEK